MSLKLTRYSMQLIDKEGGGYIIEMQGLLLKGLTLGDWRFEILPVTGTEHVLGTFYFFN